MPYNLGMNQLTLVLPFALPPPELAPDLVRALQTPALASLVARTTEKKFSAFDNATRLLPHEAWLADALGLSAAPALGRVQGGAGGGPGGDNIGAGSAFAKAAMRGFGLAAADGTWFLLHPVHVQIARNHLVMADPRAVPLDEADARALFDAAKPYFDDIDKPLLYGDAQTWFMRADDWADLATASPDAASGQNLTAYMPEGGSARASRKLQNEVQMLWFEHPVNQARQARGLKPINSFWLWAGATAPAPAPAAALFTVDCQPWLAALAEPARRDADLAAVLASGQERALVVAGGLVETGLASEWSPWLLQLQRLEQDWLASLLAALKDGRLGRLTLVLSHRDAYATFGSSKNAQRKFWRKPSLNHLIR